MPYMDESELRRWRRLIDTPNNPKSQTGRSQGKKMLIYDEQSRYVYENKQNYDIKSDEMSDIYGKVTRILQKIPGFEGQSRKWKLEIRPTPNDLVAR